MRKRAVMAVAGMVLLLVVWGLFTAPKYPRALIRVVDGGGRPVPGAMIRPEGLRIKTGAYSSGYYGWAGNSNAPPVTETSTDAKGEGWVSYPKYVLEKLETGQICFSVTHPDFVPDHPERFVNGAPPRGAPWKEWLDYLLLRIQYRVWIARTEPVVLQRGAFVKLSGTGGVPGTNKIYAQLSGFSFPSGGFWTNPTPEVVLSQQVRPGRHLVRLVQLDEEGVTWFSEAVSINATTNGPTELQLDLKRGVSVSGKLDDSVPRPVKRGRVIAHVTPANLQLKDEPPQWHVWTETKEDGSFRLDGLPPGLLEIYGMCDGFISTNGPGQFGYIRYPQEHEIGTNDVWIQLGMERTARVEVTVLDDAGKPLSNAKVSTWPNIRYGEWAASVFGSDGYNTADLLQKGNVEWRQPPELEGITDAKGVAILANVPATETRFGVEHAAFQLPAVDDGDGRKRREGSMKLTAGETNRMSIRLERKGTTEIAHYPRK